MEDADPTTVGPPTVFLVEGDMGMRRMLQLALERAQVAVKAMADGADLLPRLRAHAAAGCPPGMVVADLDMPGGAAVRTLERVGQLWPEVPLVLITAFGEPQTMVRARQLDPVAVLEKPFSLAELRRLVEQHALSCLHRSAADSLAS